MPEREDFMKLRSSKAAMYVGLAMVMFFMPIVPNVVDAKPTYEQQKSAKIETEQKEASYTENVLDIVATGFESSEETDMYADMAISIEASYVSVYEQASDDSTAVGRLYNNNIMKVLEVNGNWAKITSANVNGYVRTSSLCFSEEAEALAADKDVVVTVTSDVADVYASQKGDTILTSVEKETKYTAVGKCNGYIIVSVDDSTTGYIPNNCVSVDYGYDWGYTIAEAEEKEAAEKAAAAAAAAKKAAEEAAKREAERIARNKVTIGVTYRAAMTVSEEEVYLLACLIDYEAGWEPYEGKLAVANVVLNRVLSPYYGSTITQVIYSPGQFTGVSDGNYGPSTRFKNEYLGRGPRTAECMTAAREALAGKNNIGTFKNFRSLGKAQYAKYSKYTVIKNHCFF